MKGTSHSAVEFLPAQHDINSLRKAARNCRGCTLYERAIQTVFGAGNPRARLVLVGEQPGDREDMEGLPFVGPAGWLLDRCLIEAGIDRKDVYVTNAVKHFKWEPRGKRRIHKKPNTREITACRPWLDAEMDAIKPKLIVCLGATAAQALLGQKFRVTQNRGKIARIEGFPPILATVHPSSILRAQDNESRERDKIAFINDLRKASEFLKEQTRTAM